MNPAVNRVFHAPFTLPRRKKRLRFVAIDTHLLLKRPRKRKNAKESFGPELQESVGSVLKVENPSNPPLLTREHREGKKAEKNIFIRTFSQRVCQAMRRPQEGETESATAELEFRDGLDGARSATRAHCRLNPHPQYTGSSRRPCKAKCMTAAAQASASADRAGFLPLKGHDCHAAPTVVLVCGFARDWPNY